MIAAMKKGREKTAIFPASLNAFTQFADAAVKWGTSNNLYKKGKREGKMYIYIYIIVRCPCLCTVGKLELLSLQCFPYHETCKQWVAGEVVR